ncbi:MAG: YycC family protein [Bacilli bacterium]
MKRNEFSLEAAQRMSELLRMPIEEVMHTPRHILMQKLMEIEQKEKAKEE